MATVTCPSCAQPLELPDDLAGETVRCAKCQQTFATGARSSVAMGEPPARSETGVTENAPPAEAPREVDSDGFPGPRQRRDIAEKSSPVVPIVIVGAVVVLGLCVCAAPAVVFLGFIMPLRVAAHRAEEEHAVALMADQRAEAAAERAKAERPKGLQGFVKGVAEAQDAILKGKLLLKQYPPLPAPGWHGEYIKLLKERCKCDYEAIGAPNLPKEQQDEIKGWNETMNVELGRRHGNAILADLQVEAEKRWRDRLKAKENK
jgi:LSD1 subclass zinc finger protein